MERRQSSKGQATMEYVMLLGMIAASGIFVLSLFYSGKDIESMVNAWGDLLATQIAGERMDAHGDAWAVD